MGRVLHWNQADENGPYQCLQIAHNRVLQDNLPQLRAWHAHLGNRSFLESKYALRDFSIMLKLLLQEPRSSSRCSVSHTCGAYVGVPMCVKVCAVHARVRACTRVCVCSHDMCVMYLRFGIELLQNNQTPKSRGQNGSSTCMCMAYSILQCHPCESLLHSMQTTPVKICCSQCIPPL